MPVLVVGEGPDKGESFEIPRSGLLLVGRSSDCQLVLTDSKVSRQHFRVEVTPGGMTITDLGSHNGTLLNGKRVALPARLGTGDEVRIGDTVIAVQESDTEDLLGKELGGYRLEEKLGSGGMGEVYKATQLSLDRTVAVKVLSRRYARDPAFIDRFIQEARAAARLDHPNVVKTFDCGEAEGRYFYSMEYMPGGSVQDLVQGGRKLEPLHAAKLALQGACALEYAEKKGIVHCDVKPENFMLTSEKTLKLADLGIAKHPGESATSAGGEVVLGSPHYMSPEQARGHAVDHRSDIYSFGATLYRLLVGRPPFTGMTAREIMEKQVKEEPEPVRDVNPDVPGVLAQVVARCLKKRPRDRYRSAGELARGLEEARDLLAGAAAIETGKAPSSRRARKSFFTRLRGAGPMKTLVAVAGSLVLLVATVLILFGVRPGGGRRFLDEGLRLEEAGKLEEALIAYREALERAESEVLKARAEGRVEALEEQLERKERLARARRMVQEAEKKAAESPEALAEALKLLKGLEDVGPVEFEAAQPALERLASELEKAADEELKRRKERADRLAAQMRFGEAVAQLEAFPAHFSRTGAKSRADEAATELRQRAEEVYKEALDRAKALVEEKGAESPGTLAQAQRILAPFTSEVGIPELASRARDDKARLAARLEEIRRAKQETTRQARLKEAEDLVRAAGLLRRIYHFKEAKNALRQSQLLFRESGEPRRATGLEGEVRAITGVEILFEMLVGRIEKRQIPIMYVGFRSGRAGVLHARTGSDELTVRREDGEERVVFWSELPPAEMLKLFRAMRPRGSERLAVVEFALGHGLVEEARRAMPPKTAIRAGDMKLAEALRERFRNGKAAPPGMMSAREAREEDAKVLVELALKDRELAREAERLLSGRYSATAAASRIGEVRSAAAEDP